MKLDKELIEEIEKISIYSARRVFGYKATASGTDADGKIYNGCYYLEELKQDILLLVVEDKGFIFKKALKKSKKRFVGLIFAVARNLAMKKLRDSKQEVPISQIDTDLSDFFGETDETEPVSY